MTTFEDALPNARFDGLIASVDRCFDDWYDRLTGRAIYSAGPAADEHECKKQRFEGA